ncbi:MAG: lipopolysaccharide biosynthesis protein [Nitrospira sp.]|jgi:O-antigen/teichoic acid export membrane protein|nr:MAG: lipopolysaccharide biosynthesis protein [Nitrospira sp.]
MMSSKAKIFRNVIYTGLTKGTTVICMAVTSMIVARNLSPSDYGVVAFAGIIIGFLGQFSDLGVGSAAVRRPSLDKKSLQTAFTLKIILGVGAFLAVQLIALFAHHFFEHPATGDVMRVLAFNFLLSTIGFMPWVTLTREQNFRALVVPGVLSVVARSVIAITLVLSGWEYWSIVVADIGATIVSTIAIQLMRKIPMGFHFDWHVAQEYLRFGAPLLGSGILVFFLFNLDNLLIGSVMGSIQLGYYALAFTWGSFICSLLRDTVNSVLFPAFSAIQDDTAAMRRRYLKTVDLVAFLSLIVNTTLLANAHFFLVTFLGNGSDKWVSATSSFEILCIYGIIRATTEPLGNCIMALGRTRVLLQANILAGLVEVVLLALVVISGKIELVAAVVLVAYATQAVIYIPFLRRHLGIGVRDLAGQLWPIVPALLAGYGATLLVPASLGDSLATLAVRALFTASVVAFVHGLCTRFRCFHEARGMIFENMVRARA